MLERSGSVKNYFGTRPIPSYVPRPRPSIDTQQKRLYIPPHSPDMKRPKVTIAAGFRCSDGLVLCADTMISSWAHKFAQTKFVIREYPSCRAVFVFAGTVAIQRMALEKIGDALQVSALTWDAVNNAIASTVLDFNVQYAAMYPQENVPCALCALLVSGEDKLRFRKIEGAAFFCIEENFDVIGIGEPVANYLMRMQGRKKRTMDETAIEAAQMLLRVKSSVTYVGGHSQIIKIPSQGRPRWMQYKYLAELERHIGKCDKELQKLGLASLLPDNEQFDAMLAQSGENLRSLRKRFIDRVSPADRSSLPEEEEMYWNQGAED
jgi:hypothetical protein